MALSTTPFYEPPLFRVSLYGESRVLIFFIPLINDQVHGSPDLPQNRSRADIERSEKTGLLMKPEDLEDDDGAMNTVD